MIILGLNAFGHDAAAVLLVDGQPLFAASQERFDRQRHSPAWPAAAIDAALRRAGIGPGQVDAVAFPWTRAMAKWHKAWHVLRRLPRSRAYFAASVDTRLPDRRAYLRAMGGLERRLRGAGFTAPLHRVPHHLAHAASAALALPGGTGAVLTADGMGEWTTAATWRAEAHRLTRLRNADYPHSPGKVYATVTQWLGFLPESDEGKTMGLAAYGERRAQEGGGSAARLRAAEALLDYDKGRLCRIPEAMFGFPWGEAQLYSDAFNQVFGAARDAAAPLAEEHELVACGVQRAVTRWGVAAAADLGAATGASALALAGGLFLNCAMNGKILAAEAARGRAVHPFPVAGDAGAAWGAAAEVHRRATGRPAAPLGTICLGSEIDEEQARQVAAREGLRRFDDPRGLAAAVAAHIAAGDIVAVARGRAEFGPRALGCRSVLASPTTLAARDRVNARKGREAWRPLAPIVRVEDTRWFRAMVPSPYMILTFEATEEARARIPGVVHVDGTARVQTVAAGENGFLRDVLDALEARGEPPVLINTSFNRRGEPIVDTAEQAWTSYTAMELDALVLGDHLHVRTPVDA